MRQYKSKIMAAESQQKIDGFLVAENFPNPTPPNNFRFVLKYIQIYQDQLQTYFSKVSYVRHNFRKME